MRVKRSEHGVIVDPFTLPPDGERLAKRPKSWKSGTSAEFRLQKMGKFKGILTRRDLRFLESTETRIAGRDDEGKPCHRR